MKKALGNMILEWALELTVTVTICLIIIEFLAQVAFVHKSSMLPTIRDNNVLIVEKISAKFKNIDRGDIVTINNIYSNDAESRILIKRVIGVAGDYIEIKDDLVYLNGKALKEGYINGHITKPVDIKYNYYTVPENCVYVLGDNRIPGESLDSRSFGAISLDTITGKAVFRLFPLFEIGIVK